MLCRRRKIIRRLILLLIVIGNWVLPVFVSEYLDAALLLFRFILNTIVIHIHIVCTFPNVRIWRFVSYHFLVLNRVHQFHLLRGLLALCNYHLLPTFLCDSCVKRWHLYRVKHYGTPCNLKSWPPFFFFWLIILTLHIGWGEVGHETHRIGFLLLLSYITGWNILFKIGWIVPWLWEKMTHWKWKLTDHFLYASRRVVGDSLFIVLTILFLLWKKIILGLRLWNFNCFNDLFR